MIFYILGFLSFYVLVGIIKGIITYKKCGKAKCIYSLKQSCNKCRGWVNVLVGLYLCVGGINLLPPVVRYVEYEDNWLVHSFPIGLAILIIYIVVYVMVKGFYPKIKYNEQELQWENEKKLAFRAKHPNIPKWLIWIWEN